MALTVEASELAQLAVRPRGISASFSLGGEARREQITVFNLGDGLLDFQVSASTASRIPWLSVEPASGTATLARPASVAAVLDPGGLAAGTYSGLVTVFSPATNQTVTVPVKIAVSVIPQAIRLSQRGLTFTAIAGGGAPYRLVEKNLRREPRVLAASEPDSCVEGVTLKINQFKTRRHPHINVGM